jgi:hypothetical protein
MNFSLSSKIVILLTNITLINCLTKSVKSQSALDNYLAKYGYHAAYKICQVFTSSRLRNDCLTVIDESYFLDINAVSLCESKFWVSERTVNCFEYITNKIYSYSELQICGNSNNEYDIYQCLDRLGANTTKDDLRNITDIYEMQNAYENAQAICQSFNGLTAKNNCHKLIDNSIFLDLNAVTLCKSKFSLSTQIVNCFRTIVDRVYSYIEIDNCSKNISKDKIIECLSTSGYVLDSSN